MKLILPILALSLTTCALTFREGSAYDPEHRIGNPEFFLSEYDFGGVGSSGNRRVTAITPWHGIGAAHYPAGGTLTFNDGSVATITSRTNISGDLDLYTFDRPISTWYGVYVPYAESVEVISCYRTEREGRIDTSFGISADIVVVGKPMSAGRNTYADTFSIIENDSMYLALAYAAWTLEPDAAVGTSGDSGSPTFIGIDGELYLFFTAQTAYTYEMVDGSIAGATVGPALWAFQTELTSLTGGLVRYTLPPSIPEPAGIILWLFLAGCLIKR